MTTKDFHVEPIAHLQALGFTEYAACAYVALLEHGPMSGYAWALQAGIPRPNIYAVAEKLAARGAVQRVQGEKGKVWMAVPAEALLGSMHEHYRNTLAAAGDALAELGRGQDPALVFSLRDGELLVRARQLIDAAEKDLLVAIQPAEAARLAEPLRRARARGVTITTLCLEACAAPCGGCQGDLHRHAMAPCDGSRWLILAHDEVQALVGRFAGRTAEGLVTGQRLVVALAAAYIRQSLALVTLGDELAGRFDGLLSTQARELLRRLLPEDSFPVIREIR